MILILQHKETIFLMHRNTQIVNTETNRFGVYFQDLISINRTN